MAKLIRTTSADGGIIYIAFEHIIRLHERKEDKDVLVTLSNGQVEELVGPFAKAFMVEFHKANDGA